MKNDAFAYLLARLAIGMSFFGHGLVRLPKLEAFSKGIVNTFAKSMLPEILVRPFSYLLPFLELLTGVLLLLGLFTRFSILLGAAIMLALIFGSSLIEQWENVFIQLFYAAYLAVLLCFLASNSASLDALRNSRKPTTAGRTTPGQH